MIERPPVDPRRSPPPLKVGAVFGPPVAKLLTGREEPPRAPIPRPTQEPAE